MATEAKATRKIEVRRGVLDGMEIFYTVCRGRHRAIVSVDADPKTDIPPEWVGDEAVFLALQEALAREKRLRALRARKASGDLKIVKNEGVTT